jgi:hypothetical protein
MEIPINGFVSIFNRIVTTRYFLIMGLISVATCNGLAIASCLRGRIAISREPVKN